MEGGEGEGIIEKLWRIQGSSGDLMYALSLFRKNTTGPGDNHTALFLYIFIVITKL